MSTERDESERVMAEFLRLVAALVLNNAAVAARLGLGVSDLQVLSLVRRTGRLTAGELARQTGLSTGSVTGLVDRLVKAGYATRARDDRDRRRVHVSADPEGMARIDAHYAHWGRHMDDVLARRTAVELAVIAGFLADLNDVDAMIAPPPE